MAICVLRHDRYRVARSDENKYPHICTHSSTGPIGPVGCERMVAMSTRVRCVWLRCAQTTMSSASPSSGCWWWLVVLCASLHPSVPVRYTHTLAIVFRGSIRELVRCDMVNDMVLNVVAGAFGCCTPYYFGVSH